jgi:hypothetical protein
MNFQPSQWNFQPSQWLFTWCGLLCFMAFSFLTSHVFIQFESILAPLVCGFIFIKIGKQTTLRKTLSRYVDLNSFTIKFATFWLVSNLYVSGFYSSKWFFVNTLVVDQAFCIKFFIFFIWFTLCLLSVIYINPDGNKDLHSLCYFIHWILPKYFPYISGSCLVFLHELPQNRGKHIKLKLFPYEQHHMAKLIPLLFGTALISAITSMVYNLILFLVLFFVASLLDMLQKMESVYFNNQMQWEVIVSSNIVNSVDNDFTLVYTSINGKKFERSVTLTNLEFLTQPILEDENRPKELTKSVCVLNTVFFMISSYQFNLENKLEQKLELLQYDFSTSKQLNRYSDFYSNFKPGDLCLNVILPGTVLLFSNSPSNDVPIGWILQNNQLVPIVPPPYSDYLNLHIDSWQGHLLIAYEKNDGKQLICLFDSPSTATNNNNLSLIELPHVLQKKVPFCCNDVFDFHIVKENLLFLFKIDTKNPLYLHVWGITSIYDFIEESNWEYLGLWLESDYTEENNTTYLSQLEEVFTKIKKKNTLNKIKGNNLDIQYYDVLSPEHLIKNQICTNENKEFYNSNVCAFLQRQRAMVLKRTEQLIKESGLLLPRDLLVLIMDHV